MANFGCPPPFLSPNEFQDDGYSKGRFCRYDARLGLECCLPCPMTDWVYPDSFDRLSDIAGWLSLLSGACCIFLCLSWAVLPVKMTSRHYLSICLTVAVYFMTGAFVVPLVARPGRCHDAITPHDMHTSSACGASGFLVHFGGSACVTWLLLRSLTLHLQICWGRQDTRLMRAAALTTGWGLPTLLTALSLALSGVSVRFGDVCYINHEYSLRLTWMPMLVLSGLAAGVSFATLGYCIRVYVCLVLHGGDSTPEHYTGGRGGGSAARSLSVVTMSNPLAVYRRTMDAVRVQWRGIAVVLVILADVVFFSVVFVFQDEVVRGVTSSPTIGEDWGLCLVTSRGNKEACLDLVKEHVMSYEIVIAVMILLAFNGVWLLLFLGRWSMVIGWRDLLATMVRRWRQPNAESTYENNNEATPQRIFFSAAAGRRSVESSVVSCQLSPVGVRSLGPLEGSTEFSGDKLR